MKHDDLIKAVENRQETQGALGSVAARQAERDRIQADIDAFLARGGKVVEVPILRRDPAQKSWRQIGAEMMGVANR